MSEEYNVFGKKSYEYAIGSIRANSFPPFSPDQWNRMREADLSDAKKLLTEYGYPVKDTPSQSIEAGLAQAVSFIREIAPDEELIDLLFFEEDAVNLKLYRKAKLIGKPSSELKPKEGGLNPELLRICAETDDYSLLGEKTGERLSVLEQETDPCRISCMIDNAMFLRAISRAKEKRCTALTSLLEAYGNGRNKVTFLRLRKLGLSPEEYEFAFLPTEDGIPADSGETTLEECLEETNTKMNQILSEISYDGGMGVIAQYYFQKKNEASALRLLFAEKGMTGKGGV